MVVGSVRPTLPCAWVIIKTRCLGFDNYVKSTFFRSDKHVKPKLSGLGNQVRSMCLSLVIMLDPQCLDMTTKPA